MSKIEWYTHFLESRTGLGSLGWTHSTMSLDELHLGNIESDRI